MRIPRICGWTALLLLTVVSSRVQAVDLPAPSGPHAVGTLVFDLTDGAREEVWTESLGDPRRLVVQLWYPAQATDSAPPAPYVVRGEAMKRSLHEFWDDMPAVRTQARLEAPLPPGRERFPLLVFSHGMNSAGFFYTALLEELASRGYIVAAIDHSYWSIGEAFADGEIIHFDDSMVALDKLSSDEIDRMMREGIATMAGDQAFVARELVAGELPGPAARIAARIDPARVGILGHSMGGMAAQVACLNWVQFRCCASLDGAAWNPVVVGMQPASSRKPLLLLLSQQFFDPSAEFATHYLQSWKTPTVLLLHNSRHNSFTDFPLLEPAAVDAPDPHDMFVRLSTAVRLFLDEHLKAAAPKEALESPGAIEGVEVIRLGDLASRKQGAERSGK